MPGSLSLAAQAPVDISPQSWTCGGTDPKKYANELGECTEIKRQLPVYADGGAISKCMAARGSIVIDPLS